MSDDASYNPAGSQSFDNAEYQPRSGGDDVPINVRGGAEQQTAFDAEREDRAAAESEMSGRIPKG